MRNYLFAFLILVASSAHAGLNKWVDEHGKVHYSDQPPPTGVEASKVRASPPPAIAPAPSKTYTEREAELKKARQTQTEANDRAALEQSNRETGQANCNSARQGLRSLQADGRIIEYDESGERRYLSDDERRQRAAEAQAEMAKWCK